MVFLIGGQARLQATAYVLVYAVGHTVWGCVFIGCSILVGLALWRCPRFLRWALLIEAVPYIGLSVSFGVAVWRYPDANLTAAPVYAWLAISHVLLSDFARRESPRQ